MPTLSIPDEVFLRAFKESAAQTMESLTMVSAKEAAAMLKITPPQLRKLAVDQFNLGRGNTRWSLQDIKALVEKRRVKSRS